MLTPLRTRFDILYATFMICLCSNFSIQHYVEVGAPPGILNDSVEDTSEVLPEIKGEGP